MTQREFANRSGRRLLRVATAEEEGQLLICVEDNRGYFVEIILPEDLAPAIAAAVLEAANADPNDEESVAIDYNDPDNLVRNGLRLLKRAVAIREYHAKPRVTVTDAQVEAVQAELSRRGGGYRRDEIRDNLQAALDSGVLQVPADNKEGE